MAQLPSRACVDAAYSLFASNLWEAIDPDELIAVRFADGRTGYCCVAGPEFEEDFVEDGENVVRLTLFMEGDGLSSYYHLHVRDPQDDTVRSVMSMTRLAYMECVFIPKEEATPEELAALAAYGIDTGSDMPVPTFRSKAFFQRDRPLQDEHEDRMLTQALRAAVYLTSLLPTHPYESLWRYGEDSGVAHTIPLVSASPLAKDGWHLASTPLPEDSPIHMDSPLLNDPEMLAQLANLRRRQKTTLYAELLCFPLPEDGTLDYPVGLFLTNLPEKHTQVPRVEHFETEKEVLLLGLIDYIQAHGRPARVLVRDDLTMLLLRPFCEQIGLPLTYQQDNAHLARSASRYLTRSLGLTR